MNKNFILTGAAGYIAPRHIEAIKKTGNNLLAVVDPHDSVGILDKYFLDVAYFKEFERFDRHISKLISKGIKIDYLSICSPNYLHDAHIRYGMRIGADVICEKPLVITPNNCDELIKIEKKYNRKINVILQARLHPSIIELKRRIDSEDNSNYKIDLTYYTPRGLWYKYSWKGREDQSGGLAANIGIHCFDILIWIFGKVLDSTVFEYNYDYICGKLTLEKALVEWQLCIDSNCFPGSKTYRCIEIIDKNDETVTKIDFSNGFSNLHVLSYEKILKGEGFGVNDAYPSIDLAYSIRKDGHKFNS